MKSIILFGLIAVFAGCAAEQQKPAEPSPKAQAVQPVLEPISSQLVKRVPPLREQRFSVLMDFESDSDAVFIGSRPQGRIAYDRAHTGGRSVRFDSTSTRVFCKLGSLLSGRQFPADWTLIGMFIWSEQPIELTMAIEGGSVDVPPRKITLSPNNWTLALLEISGERQADPTETIKPGTMLAITFPADHGRIWCDDLLLIDNSETMVGPDVPTPASAEVPPATTQGSTEPSAPQPSQASTPVPMLPGTEGWLVQRRGLSYIGAVPGKFNFKLLTSEASDAGWRLDEANALRARFSSDGSTKNLTVYADGRSYWDGQPRAMSSEVRANPIFAEQHASPAEVVIAAEFGRLNRDTPGDVNNDGYNEQRGAYTILATGPRLELTLNPRTPRLERPVLEVSGLPQGAVLVTVEGRLIQSTVRLTDGTLVIELPVRIDRPTTVNVRVQ